MNSERLIQLIRDAVKPYPKPAVFLSGGLDSTIVLHHLRETLEVEPIYTYTIYWGCESDETEQASRVSKYYQTVHRNVKILDLLGLYRHVISYIDRPSRFALWIAKLYQSAWNDKRETVYIGEGSDEHFGGYHYKPLKTYQEYWSGVLEYSIPLHKQIADLYGFRVEHPFLLLPIEQTIPYYDSKHRNKNFLRKIYKGIIPDFVLDRPKQPGRVPWLEIWDTMVKPTLDIDCPKTRVEAQRIIERWLTEKWLAYQKKR